MSNARSCLFTQKRWGIKKTVLEEHKELPFEWLIKFQVIDTKKLATFYSHGLEFMCSRNLIELRAAVGSVEVLAVSWEWGGGANSWGIRLWVERGHLLQRCNSSAQQQQYPVTIKNILPKSFQLRGLPVLFLYEMFITPSSSSSSIAS